MYLLLFISIFFIFIGDFEVSEKLTRVFELFTLFFFPKTWFFNTSLNISFLFEVKFFFSILVLFISSVCVFSLFLYISKNLFVIIFSLNLIKLSNCVFTSGNFKEMSSKSLSEI